jgi:sulfate permease, SulP family
VPPRTSVLRSPWALAMTQNSPAFFGERVESRGSRTIGVPWSSALPPKADITRTSRNVRYVPRADIGHFESTPIVLLIKSLHRVSAQMPPKLDTFARVLPILGWLPDYKRDWFRADVIAGLTLWGILIPEAIAYAVMAGAPLEAGLYTLLGSLAVYAILGTTRQAVSAPTSGSSVMMAAVVAPFLVNSPKEYAELLVLLVLLVGIILLLCGLLRLGFVTAFISHSVMTGFIFGLAIHIAVSQMPKLFGVPSSHGETVYQLWGLIDQLGNANWVTFTIGAVALALLYVLEARSPRTPAPLMIMAAGILVVSALRLSDQHGVQVVGDMQVGLPAVSLPKINVDDVLDLLPGAFAIVLFVLSETLGVGHALGRKYGYDIDPNQELVALGVSNFTAACLGGLVGGCSMSSTAVNDRAGAKSQVSSLAAAGMVLITLLALMPLFHNLPEAVLGAIVIYAVARMMKVGELKRFYQFHASEFIQAMVALLGVIAVGILPGLAIAIALSLLRFIWGASHVSISHLRPVSDEAHHYGERSPEGDSIPGLEILRLNGPLFFANALRFRNEVRSLLAGRSPPRAILLDLHANFGIDLSSTDTLLALVAEAKETKTEILFAELQDPVRHMFLHCGLLDRVGEDHLFLTVDDGVQDYLKRHPAAGRAGIAAGFPSAPRSR